MKFHDSSSLQELHIEITNRCNAACPMCSRNVYGGKDREELVYNEWTSEMADMVFSDTLKNLRNVLFCGTHGDPVVAKDCLKIVETCKRKTSATIEFYSNGSLRNKDWWHQLGNMMNRKLDDGYYRKSDIGIFSVDGLSDTNHLYRRRTNFEKIMENAEAFINAGGNARWDFLVFKHNEHQVEGAEKLAKKMGFKQFRLRKTSRFSYSPDGPDKHRVLNNQGEVEYYLEPPTNPSYRNENKEKFDTKIKNLLKDSSVYKEEISCLNKTQFNRMYVNAHLKVFPCCFISSDTYHDGSKVFTDTKSKVIEKYGSDFNSLHVSNWNSLFEHPWFKNDLVESWKDPENKLLRCLRTCSVKCNPITSQSQDVPI